MVYQVNKKDGTLISEVADGAVNTQDTSIRLLGRGVVNFGEIMAENMVQMLEHFASANPPQNVIKGQLWFDTTTTPGVLKVATVDRDSNSFVPVSGRSIGSVTTVDTDSLSAGDTVWDDQRKQYFVWDGSKLVLIGPDSESGLVTGSVTTTINGTPVTVFVVNGEVHSVLANQSVTIPSGTTQLSVGSDTLSVDLSTKFLLSEFRKGMNFAINSTLVVDSVVSNDETDLSNKDTDELTEGSTNLYFTNSRAQNAAWSIASGQNGITVDYSAGTSSAVIELSGTTDNLSEGSSNLYFTIPRAQNAVTNNENTFTADQTFDANSKLTFNTSNGQESIVYNGEFIGPVFRSSGGSSTYRVNYEGSGSEKLVINHDGDANAMIAFDGPGAQIEINRDVIINGNITLNGNDSGFSGGGSSISDTDDLPEGTSNLYFTDSRARSAVTNSSNTFSQTQTFESTLLFDGTFIGPVYDSPSGSSVYRWYHEGGNNKLALSHDGDANAMFAFNGPGNVVEVNRDLDVDGSVTSSGADLAEKYESDKALEPGDVVRIGGSKEVQKTTTEKDKTVFGVVSTKPGLTMNSRLGDGKKFPYIALVGRVNVKIVGKVKKGQWIVSSNTAGVAQAIDDVQSFEDYMAVIGRSLEDKTTEEQDLVECVIKSS